MEYNALNPHCPSHQVLDLVTHKWTILIIYMLSTRKYRYNEMLRSIEGVSKKMLTHSLRELEENGLVNRTVYPVVPPVVEYSLTPLGEALLPIIHSLKIWSESHMNDVNMAREMYAKKLADEQNMMANFS